MTSKISKFFLFTGPDLEVPLSGHSMITLGLGQAIIGGESKGQYQKTIYHFECSQLNCYISILELELAIPRASFVAMALPDHLSGCVSKGNLLDIVNVRNVVKLGLQS